MNRWPENRSVLPLVFSLLLSGVIGAQTGAGSVSGRPTHLYPCSFYFGKAAGEKKMDAGALLEYFAPPKTCSTNKTARTTTPSAGSELV